MLNWNEMNENELIEMAKNGDDEAKMLIINRYKPLVYRFLSQYYSRFSSCSSSLREDLIEGIDPLDLSHEEKNDPYNIAQKITNEQHIITKNDKIT